MPCIMPENKMDGIKGLGNGRERKIMGSYIILINYSLRGMLLFYINSEYYCMKSYWCISKMR